MYTESIIDVLLHRVANDTGPTLAATGEVGLYCPGYIPVIVRAWGIVVVNAAWTVPTTTLTLWRRPIAGNNGGRVAIKSFTPTLTAQVQPGVVNQARGLNTLIKPGEDLLLEVIATGGTGRFNSSVLLEPAPEQMLNNSNMIKAVLG